MKKLICIIFVLLLTVATFLSCSFKKPSTGTETSTETGASTDVGSGDIDTDKTPSTDDNGGENGDVNGNEPSEPENPDVGGNEPSEPENPDVGGNEPSEPENPDVGGNDPDEPSGDEMTKTEITVFKTADEMAASIGKGTNGDIVSGKEIKLDSNIYVSFGKGAANTEPALYSGAIRIYQNGGTLTVGAKNGSEIKSVIITFSDGKDGNDKLTVSGGGAPTKSGNTLTISPNSIASSVTVTVSGANKSDRLYVEAIEVVYIGQGGNENPDTGDGGNGGQGGTDESYTYNDFTSSEKSTYNEYVGFVIPFLPNNDYYVEGYDEEGYRGVYFSALCESDEAFVNYIAKFSSYTNDGTEVDSEGDTWYLYSKNGVYVDVCYYEHDGYYYVDVDAWFESSGDDTGDNGGDTGDGNEGGDTGDNGDENDYLYYEFTASEENTYNQYIGFVIPFLPNNEYYVKPYNEDGYVGVYYSALCESETAFSWYLAMFSSYGYDGEITDDYGYTWNCYSKNEIYIDVCYYEDYGAYYVDVDAYYEESGGNGNTGDNGGNGGNTDNQDVITNAGAGLPEDDGDGIYDIDFSDAENVKDVTDQGYYLDGCPTVGSPSVLVIPVEFSDRLASTYGYDIENIKKVFMQNGQTEYYSVYDYYYHSSMGQLTLDITVLDEWFRPSNKSTYYAKQTMDGELIGDQMVMDEALAYLEGIMDLSQFDSDKNQIIDAVVLITTLEVGDDDFHWAYRYWNVYTDEDGYYYEYDGVSANDYLWASYNFVHEDTELVGDYSDTSIINPYTYIHEFGHILGTDDYYDTSEYATSSPLDGHDIMDSEAGDHNAYTKFNLGWITSSRLVVTEDFITVTLKDFSKTGDTIILANNFDPSLGVYQEYYILVYYTNGELNSGMGGYFENEGILVYHVNASLFREEYEGEIYYDVYNRNTDPSDEYGTENNLIELIENENGYIFEIGDTLGAVTDDLGTPLGYTFTVDSLGDGAATITVSAK